MAKRSRVRAGAFTAERMIQVTFDLFRQAISGRSLAAPTGRTHPA